VIKQSKTVAVLGAGVAGLTTAKTLKQYGFEVTVYESRPELGGVWANNYKSLRVLEPSCVYGFPDWPWPKDASLFPDAGEVRNYLAGYAKNFGVLECIEFNTKVVSANPQDDGKWVIETVSNQQSRVGTFDFFIMAPGMFNHPKLPQWSGVEKFDGEVIHTSQFRDSSQVKGKNVAVVGFSRSAMDVSVDAVSDAKAVSIIHRSVRWPVPEKILGLIRNHVLLFARWPTIFAPPWIRSGRKVGILHHKVGFLVDLFWKFFEVLLGAQFKLKSRKVMPDRPIKLDLFTNLYITPRKFFSMMDQSKIRSVRSEIDRFDASGIHLSNGQYLAAETVICGTGWQHDYSFLPNSLLNKIYDEDGMHLYRHMVHPAMPGFAFVGGVQGINSATCYAIQATWVARWLTNQVSWPEAEAQLQEIETLRKWNESVVTQRPNRAQILNLHQLPYLDELMDDMGLKKQRKMPIAEQFAPYRSVDYKSVTATTRPR
jgi:dimethylaniline monooxygenase (N-oxide forming)